MPDSLTPQPDTERRSAPERRSPDTPTGLPIFSTEPLTEAERTQLLDLQHGYRLAAIQIELCLGIGRVDAALDVLQSLTADLDGVPTTIARTLGSNR